MKKHLLKLAVIGALWFLAPALIWAIPVNIEIKNGSRNGFTYSLIHQPSSSCNPGGSCTSGTPIYYNFSGDLWGELTTPGAGFNLEGIFGLLTASTSTGPATVKFTNGEITDPGAGFPASGYLDYELSGGPEDGNSGTFHFLSQFYGGGGPNSLTDARFYLWGNNWEETEPESFTKLGIDLKGEITEKPVPEPTTIVLLGTGLAGLGLLRYRKSRRDK